MIALIIILAIIVILFLIFIGIYNGLVGLRNQVKNAWAQIDVQLKRRYDLVPNLVETVKGYAKHERETFERVTQARAACLGARSPAELAQAENMLTGALKSLFAVAEAYPELKANQNFLQLQTELGNTENQISFSRGTYNDTVREYNTAIQMFPANLIAGLFGFRSREFFKTDTPEERQAPKVQF